MEGSDLKGNYYEILGTNRSKSIIFIHGAGVTHQWWHPQLQHFSDRFQVIAIDLPGHGVSADIPFKLDSSIEKILDLVKNLDLGKVLLVGISLGGYVAINFASKYPDSIAGLFLSGCSINMSGLRGLGFRLTGLMLRQKGTDWLEQTQLQGYRKLLEPSLLEPVLRDGFFPKAAIESFFGLSGKNFYRMLPEIPAPIMLANGENDELNRKAESKFINGSVNAVSSPILGAGHLANLEQPSTFNTYLEEFAKTLSWV
jgi:pimeloyl-ACP methyl ester carboxylesterase